MSLILVSYETPIYQEQSCLVYVRNTCSIWYFIQFVRIAIFMSLHVPAGACIPVANASPIHVFPIQRVLKHCGATNIYKYIYIYTHVIQNNLRTPQLAGFARQLGCKNELCFNSHYSYVSCTNLIECSFLERAITALSKEQSLICFGQKIKK